MAYEKIKKPSAANDNRHDQSDWNFMYRWLDFWLDRQGIPPEKWNYNRAIHYTYEKINRPWLSRSERIRELQTWLRLEATRLGFAVRYLTKADLPG